MGDTGQLPQGIRRPVCFAVGRRRFGFCACPGIGNAATFGRQIEILANQNDAEFVYLAEDDFFYLPGRFQLMLDFIRNNPDVDFCSPYDHPDYYNHSFHLHPMRIKAEQGQVWKTANGTICTFLTRKTTLRRTRSTLLSYARKNSDAGMWLSLTKQHVLNPYDLLTQPFICPYRGWSLRWPGISIGDRFFLASDTPSGYPCPHWQPTWSLHFWRLMWTGNRNSVRLGNIPVRTMPEIKFDRRAILQKFQSCGSPFYPR